MYVLYFSFMQSFVFLCPSLNLFFLMGPCTLAAPLNGSLPTRSTIQMFKYNTIQYKINLLSHTNSSTISYISSLIDRGFQLPFHSRSLSIDALCIIRTVLQNVL